MYEPSPKVVRRRNRRYWTLIVLVVLLIGGWIGFWKYAEGKVEQSIDGWKAREAAGFTNAARRPLAASRSASKCCATTSKPR
jgi:hypothetical protein